jgi:hypothetical protein
MTENPWGRLHRLVYLAESLAGAWGGRAAMSTTIGRERAILRLSGVAGLDRAGRPLASEVVERYVGTQSDRLAAGILLPFAMGVIEYDISPQDLALDVASGAVDLALEADLLQNPDRRQAAEQEATRLATSSLERIDANRTARHELLHLLGDSPQPWFGATLTAAELGEARAEAIRLIDAGADLIRVKVPAGRELSSRPGIDPSEVDVVTAVGDRFRHGAVSRFRPEVEGIPPGSQRGLSELRHTFDEAAADRRRYVRLATLGPALGAPEQAVVAAFERIDLVELDPIAEIVNDGVDPDRALADDAFALRLLRRVGCQVLIGPGPLVVAPDLALGVPSDPATRAGRALALQLVSVALARHHGLGPEQVLVGAMPGWLIEERHPTVQAIAQVALRRALFPGHALVFEEPVLSSASEGWPFMFAAAVPGTDPTALVLRQAEPERVRQVGDATRAAARVGRESQLALGPRVLHGPALDHARAAVEAARVLLERLADDGWQSVLGVPLEASIGGVRQGWDTVVDRSDEFDPFTFVQPVAS